MIIFGGLGTVQTTGVGGCGICVVIACDEGVLLEGGVILRYADYSESDREALRVGEGR